MKTGVGYFTKVKLKPMFQKKEKNEIETNVGHHIKMSFVWPCDIDTRKIKQRPGIEQIMTEKLTVQKIGKYSFAKYVNLP